MIYKIVMSKGDNIKIDEEDLVKLQTNLSAPLIRLKQAIINPSFMVSIYPTDEEEFKIKKKVEVQDGAIKIIGEEKVRVLSDDMNVNKRLKNGN